MSTRDIDHGLRRIAQQMLSLRGKAITIGLHADLGVHHSEHNDESLTVANIGSIQEFGAHVVFIDGGDMDIPARPFTALSFDQNKAEISREIESKISQMQRRHGEGLPLINGMLQVGNNHATYQKQVMELWRSPPNSPRTIKYKHRDDPLKWTGEMIAGVKAKIE